MPVSFKVELMPGSFKVGHIQNLKELAAMFDVSRRTFEKMLFNEGSIFIQIKEKYLLRKSLELLKDTRLSVKEIAGQ